MSQETFWVWSGGMCQHLQLVGPAMRNSITAISKQMNICATVLMTIEPMRIFMWCIWSGEGYTFSQQQAWTPQLECILLGTEPVLSLWKSGLSSGLWAREGKKCNRVKLYFRAIRTDKWLNNIKEQLFIYFKKYTYIQTRHQVLLCVCKYIFIYTHILNTYLFKHTWCQQREGYHPVTYQLVNHKPDRGVSPAADWKQCISRMEKTINFISQKMFDTIWSSIHNLCIVFICIPISENQNMTTGTELKVWQNITLEVCRSKKW